MSELTSKQWIVSGTVQGVFFRANVKKKAIELEITGYAKNLENGKVEILAQGKSEHIAALKQFILEHPGRARVKHIEEHEIEKEYMSGFEVY